MWSTQANNEQAVAFVWHLDTFTSVKPVEWSSNGSGSATAPLQRPALSEVSSPGVVTCPDGSGFKEEVKDQHHVLKT